MELKFTYHIHHRMLTPCLILWSIHLNFNHEIYLSWLNILLMWIIRNYIISAWSIKYELLWNRLWAQHVINTNHNNNNNMNARTKAISLIRVQLICPVITHQVCIHIYTQHLMLISKNIAANCLHIGIVFIAVNELR